MGGGFSRILLEGLNGSRATADEHLSGPCIRREVGRFSKLLSGPELRVIRPRTNLLPEKPGNLSYKMHFCL